MLGLHGSRSSQKLQAEEPHPRRLGTVGWQLSLQRAPSAQAELKSPQAVSQPGVSSDASEGLQKVRVEFSHQESLDFCNQPEAVQAQLGSLHDALEDRVLHHTPALVIVL